MEFGIAASKIIYLGGDRVSCCGDSHPISAPIFYGAEAEAFRLASRIDQSPHHRGRLMGRKYHVKGVQMLV